MRIAMAYHSLHRFMHLAARASNPQLQPSSEGNISATPCFVKFCTPPPRHVKGPQLQDHELERYSTSRGALCASTVPQAGEARLVACICAIGMHPQARHHNTQHSSQAHQGWRALCRQHACPARSWCPRNDHHGPCSSAFTPNTTRDSQIGQQAHPSWPQNTRP